MEKYKNKTLTKSVICALRGMKLAFVSEKNFAYYIVIFLMFLAVNVLLGINKWLYIAYLIPSAGVFATELVNTAIEHVCNFIYAKDHEEIGAVKDIAAGAVLFWGFGYFAVEMLIIVFTLI